MIKCDYCELRTRKEHLIYEDEEVVVAVKDTALAPGQITIFPKEHFTIFELVPDEILRRCATLANKAGIAVFESIGAQGTNVIVQNGLPAGQQVPHFALEIIPRRENDNLPLSWPPKQLMDEEMDTAFLLLKEEGDKLVNIGKAPAKKEIRATEEPDKIAAVDGKDNYLLKSLKRMP
ncbi:MAG: HIT family protein [Nanoarchaeota archaeon]